MPATEIAAKERGAVKAVRIYRARFDVSSSFTSTNLFAGQGGSELNDLPDGFLPQNAGGEIMGIMARVRTVYPTGATQETEAITRVHDYLDILAELYVELYVNGVLYTQHPFQCLSHPPGWVQGGVHATAATDLATINAQNGGYMLSFIPVPVYSRESIQVRVNKDDTESRTINDTAKCEILLQVAQVHATGGR